MKKIIVLLIFLIATLAGTSTGCSSTKDTYTWRMATSWPENNLFFTEAAMAICESIGKLSGGRLTITPYPAGEVTTALDVFDAVSQGSVEMGHS